MFDDDDDGILTPMPETEPETAEVVESVEGEGQPAGEAGERESADPVVAEASSSPPAEAQQSLFLRTIMDPDADTPAWMEAATAAIEGQEAWTPPTDEEMSLWPIEAQQAMAHVRRSAVAAAPQGAELEQTITTERAEIAAERRALAAERAQVNALGGPLKSFIDKMARPDPAERLADPFSAEGVEQRVQMQVHAALSKFAEGLQRIEGEKLETIRQAEVAHRIEEHNAVVTAYVQQHQADFDDPEIMGQVKRLVQSSMRDVNGIMLPEISVEEAHQLVMSRLSVQDQDEAYQRARETARARARRAGGGQSRIPETPKVLFGPGNDAQLLRWYAQHPEAKERDAREAKAGSTSLM